MAKYRKKPIEIEAHQYTEYGRLVKGMCNSVSCYSSGNDKPHVHTIHEGQIVNLEIGDYVIPEPDGVHFYPCKPDIFEATYESIETTLDDKSPFDKNMQIIKEIYDQIPEWEAEMRRREGHYDTD